VDYCQLYDADIDMKDERGETPLNREARKAKYAKREARKREWKAVDELVVRGADPNLLDKDGCSVMNGAISNKQWGTVKLLIEYLANIHKKAPIANDTPFMQLSDSESSDDREWIGNASVCTPLQHLITKRQGELIHHTLMWCPDLDKGVNNKLETTLHAIVLDNSRKLRSKIYSLLY
jgi:ankyrin repeat protein